MIVTFPSAAEKRDARIKLYRDDVFVMALGAIGKVCPKLSVEELFATADRFTQFLVEYDLSDPDVMQYEVEELRAEMPDSLSFYLVISLTYIKLCALSMTKPHALGIARTLNGFCQEYDGFPDFLKQLFKKEQLMERRANLLAYELQTIDTADAKVDCQELVASILEIAEGLSYEAVEKLELVLSNLNDKYMYQYQAELDKLRAIRASKSEQKVEIGEQHNNNCQQFMNKVENSNIYNRPSE